MTLTYHIYSPLVTSTQGYGVKCDNFQKPKNCQSLCLSTLTCGSIPSFILVIKREIKQYGKTTTKMSARYSEGDENLKKATS